MARKKKKKEVKKDSFIVLMTALAIILLAFFIILNTIAVADEEKIRKTLGSLIGSFGIMPSGLRAQKSEGKSITPTSIPMVKPENEIALILSALEDYAKEEEGGGSLGVYMSKKGLVISIGEKFAFDSGSAEIKPMATSLLKKIAEILSRFKNRIYIEGHTDNVPINTEEFRSNWELSTARAVNTLRFLEEELNFPGERLAAVGYGSVRPIVPNDTTRHKAMNRRVEIVISKKKGTTIDL